MVRAQDLKFPKKLLELNYQNLQQDIILVSNSGHPSILQVMGETTAQCDQAVYIVNELKAAVA